MCTFKTNKIYLSWRKDYESQRRIIGVLEKSSDNYFFYYIQENIGKAKEEGFSQYPPFEELNKKYSENVIEIFARRLVNPLRKDYKDFLEYWCAQNYIGDIFALLGLTGAKLLTDNFEFIAPHEECPAKFLTNVSWLKIANNNVIEKIRTLSFEEIEKKLSLFQDKKNTYNPKAILVKYDGLDLGYIKSIHCENIYNAIESNKDIKLKVKNIIRNGIVKEILLYINYS